MSLKAPVTYPSRRDLLQPLQGTQINLLDFLRLSDCDLQRLVGERNSVLGKVMPMSQRLIYERQFVQLGELCLDSLSESESRQGLVEALKVAIVAKRTDMPSLEWNATAAGEEFQQLFSEGALPLSLEEARVPTTELFAALQQLHQEIIRPLPNSAALENLLGIIGSAKTGGQLLLSERLLIRRLNELTAAVSARRARRPLCFQGRPSPEAKIAETVMLKYYIAEIQPYISDVFRQSRDLRTSLLELLEPYHPWPEAFQDYWQANWSEDNAESTWMAYQDAVQSHTQMWRDLLDECGLAPGDTSP